MEGYLYILSNPLMPSILKIGITSRSTEERRRELSRPSGIPDEFRIEYEIFSPSVKILEKRVHKDFNSLRINKSKEFFKVDLNTAIAVIGERNEELYYDITAKTGGINETNHKYEAIEILGKLRQIYGSKIRDEIQSIRIYQTALRCYLEVTEQDNIYGHLPDNLSPDEKEFYKTPLIDQKIHRMDLLFICDMPENPKDNDIPIFNPKNSASENARRFVNSLDEYAINMCTDILKR